MCWALFHQSLSQPYPAPSTVQQQWHLASDMPLKELHAHNAFKLLGSRISFLVG